MKCIFVHVYNGGHWWLPYLWSSEYFWREERAMSEFPQILTIRREGFTALNVAHLFHLSIIIFEHNRRAHRWLCPVLARLHKIRRRINPVTALATAHKQPFPLPNYCAMYQTIQTAPVLVASILKSTDNAVE